MKRILSAGRPMTLIVLAGGQSRRMGRDKALLSAGSETLLAATVRPLADFFDEILIGVSPGQRIPYPPGRVVADEIAGQGPLRGILTGLRAARNEACFLLACDMPGLRAAVVRKIARASKDAEIAIAVSERALKEPLLGVYKKTLIPVIESLLAHGQRSVLALFDRVRTGEVFLDPGDIPPNINTPTDFGALTGSGPLSGSGSKPGRKR